MARTTEYRQARAMIAERLAALGHGPDFLAPEAVEEILKRSHGERQGIQAALAATLFLASTEDALRVGRDLVQRAVPADEDDYGAPAQARPGVRGWIYVGAPLVLACAATALFLSRPGPPVRLPSAAAPIQAPLPAPPKAAAAQKAAHLAAVPRDILPVAPPAAVTLLITQASGQEQAQLAALLASMLPAGFGRVDVKPAPALAIVQHHRLAYFFAQDEPLAQHIALQLNAADAGGTGHIPWKAFLVNPPGDTTPRPPGSIEADAR